MGLSTWLPLTLTLSPFAPKWRDGERGSGRGNYTRSNRSAFITLVQAATKSRTNLSLESLWP